MLRTVRKKLTSEYNQIENEKTQEKYLTSEFQ